MFRRLRNWLSSSSQPKARSRQQPARFRPLVESLEDRLAPAILTVNSLLDSIDHTLSNLSLREAIAAVNAGSTAGFNTGELGQITGTIGSNDEIRFDILLGGSYELFSGQLTISRSVKIDGGGNGFSVTIFPSTRPGSSQFRVFDVTGGTVEFKNLTVSGGAGNVNGAGIHCNGGTVTITDCTISNNSTTAIGGGGGLAVTTGSMTVTNSTISGNNSTTEGGGAVVASGSTLTITNCTFLNNTASGKGGAIRNGGTLNAVNSTFQNNRSTGNDGGAIHTIGALTVTGSTFTGNTALLSGGALGVSGSQTARLINSTMSGNSAVANGGAINVDASASLVVTNSTLVLNRADSDGNNDGNSGGISQFTSGSVTLNNSIVAGNLRGIGAGSSNDLSTSVASASSNNLIGNPGSAGGLTEGVNGNRLGNGAGGVLPLSSILNTTLANNGGPTLTHALVAGSRAVNAGSNALAVNASNVALTTDQRGSGNPRIVFDVVDSGAVEFNPALPSANPLVVGTTGDTFDGDFGTGQLSLREAVFIANNRTGADTITFAAGISTITLTTSGYTLFGSAKTTIDGGSGVTIQRSPAQGTPLFRIFDVTGGTVDFTNLTVSGGAGNFNGAGIHVSSSGTVTITNCTISNNSSTSSAGGGGLFVTSGSMTVTNSTISGNSSTTEGGGARVSSGGTLTINNCTFLNNTASRAGGAIRNDGTLNVVNSTFQGNRSTGNDGGAIHTTGALTVTGSTFTSNTAFLSGGALAVNGSQTARLINSTMSGNSATANGGAINVADTASLVVTNSTLVLNRADSDGNNDGVSGAISRFASGSVTLNNSIVAGNLRGSGAGSSDDLTSTVAATSSNNLIGNPGSAGGLSEGVNGNRLGNGAGGVLSLSSILNPTLANNGGPTQTHALVAGSRAVNAGSNALAVNASNAALTTDQRGGGNPRVAFGVVDSGAVEFTAALPSANPLVVGTTSDTFDGDFGTGQLSLREAVFIANNRTGADTITFTAGINTFTLTTSGFSLTDTAKTTINGGSGVTIQRSQAQGTPLFRLFDVVGGTVDFNNLTISGGAGNFDGAGIHNGAGTITITNCTISNNSSTSSDGGGGLFVRSGSMTVTNSTISGNSSTTEGGGAVVVFDGISGSLTINNCTFLNNTTSGAGGAIRNDGSLSVVNSTFQGNRSTANNSGAIHSTGPLTVTGSTFTGNTALGSGGALSVSGSASARLINSTVSGNVAAANGGAINVNDTASLTVTNSTLVLNRADSDGNNDGISGAISKFASGTVTLNNSIVAGNLRGSGAGSSDDLSTTVAAASSNNLIGDPGSAGGLTEGANGNLVGNGTGGVLPLSSILNATLANNGGATQTHALVLNSRALNAGSNALAVNANNAALTTDQSGAPRQLGSNVDVGAIEYQGPNQAPVNTVPLTKLKLKKNRIFTFAGLLSVADADAGAGAIQVSLAVTKGKLLLTSANNVTIVGSNTKLMTLTGTVSAVNAALAALQYKPSSTYIGGVTLTMTTSDQGNTGNPLTDVDVLKLGLS